MEKLLVAVVAAVVVAGSVVVAAVLAGLFLGPAPFLVVQIAVPAAFMADWTWLQHVAAAALVTLYGGAAFRAPQGRG